MQRERKSGLMGTRGNGKRNPNPSESLQAGKGGKRGGMEQFSLERGGIGR